jgi:hypothetical protein
MNASHTPSVGPPEAWHPAIASYSEHLKVPVVTRLPGAEEAPEVTRIEKDKKTG